RQCRHKHWRLPSRRRCELLRCCAAARRLDLERVAAAFVGHDHVGHAGDDAETLHDRGLDRLAIAAIRDVKRKGTRRSAGAQVLENGALDCVFRPTAQAGALYLSLPLRALEAVPFALALASLRIAHVDNDSPMSGRAFA